MCIFIQINQVGSAFIETIDRLISPIVFRLIFQSNISISFLFVILSNELFPQQFYLKQSIFGVWYIDIFSQSWAYCYLFDSNVFGETAVSIPSVRLKDFFQSWLVL